MAQYRKKPVVIEAKKNVLDRDIVQEIADWCSGRVGTDGSIFIDTLEGVMQARTGDFIIRGVNGEFYPCKPDIFNKTYEAI